MKKTATAAQLRVAERRPFLVKLALDNLRKHADYVDGCPKSYMRPIGERGDAEYALIRYVEELESKLPGFMTAQTWSEPDPKPQPVPVTKKPVGPPKVWVICQEYPKFFQLHPGGT